MIFLVWFWLRSIIVVNLQNNGSLKGKVRKKFNNAMVLVVSFMVFSELSLITRWEGHLACEVWDGLLLYGSLDIRYHRPRVRDGAVFKYTMGRTGNRDVTFQRKVCCYVLYTDTVQGKIFGWKSIVRLGLEPCTVSSTQVLWWCSNQINVFIVSVRYLILSVNHSHRT